MHPSHFPQCTIQNRNVHISVLNGALWDMVWVHCGISKFGLLESRHSTSPELCKISMFLLRFGSRQFYPYPLGLFHWHWGCCDLKPPWSISRDRFVNAPSQWETMLQCNAVSHWLDAFTKWSLIGINASHKSTKKLWWNQKAKAKQDCVHISWDVLNLCDVD